MAVLSDNLRSTGKVFSALTDDTEVAVASKPCLIDSIHVLNETGADAYLQLFNALLADVTIGTTAPTLVVGVSPNDVQSITFRKPIRFNIGLVVGSTTERAGSSAALMESIIIYAD